MAETFPGPAITQKPETIHLEALNQQLDRFDAILKQELAIAKGLAERREQGEEIPDFDIRGKLYAISEEIAPEARGGDIREMHDLIKPKPGEVSVDLAAGGGFITKPILEWTHAKTYAVDPSREQLKLLDKYCNGKAEIVLGSPDDAAILDSLPCGEIDFVTSFGGLHHVPDQSVMMKNIAKMLKEGGRFVAADVCGDTALARHFDEFVAKKCITGHKASWLTESRLEELIRGTSLSLKHAETRPLTWIFNSEREMALFFKALHAYDLPDEEVIKDLQGALGISEKEGKVHLNWPMIFFELVKS